MMIGAEQNIAKRRLTILRILYEADGTSNTSTIETALRACGFVGKALPFGCVAEDCELMQGHGLVFVERLAGQFGEVITVHLGKIGVAYLAREVPAIDGIEYPKIGW
jgi:hypothetical protein